MDAKKKYWKERKATAAQEKRQAHIQTVMDEPNFEEEDNHQEEDEDLNFAFMEKGQEENTMLKEQQARKTLKP